MTSLQKVVVTGLIGAALSITSLIGYVTMPAVTLWKVVIGVYYLVGTVTLFLMAARKMKKSELIWLAIATAVLSVLAEQLLGFLFFPGLVKDIPAFSERHILMALALFLIANVWYSVVTILASVINTSFKKGKKL